MAVRGGGTKLFENSNSVISSGSLRSDEPPRARTAHTPSTPPVLEKEVNKSESFDNLLAQICLALQEWNDQLKIALVAQDFAQYNSIKSRMSTLLMWRQQLQDKSTPLSVQAFAKSSVIRVIEDSRKFANRYVVPRNRRGDVVDEKNTATTDMLKLHREMQISMNQERQMVTLNPEPLP